MRAFLLLLLTATLSAAGLKVGDEVPATRPATQLQGEAVKDFEKGKVYVFECWATWCGPCIGAIPHLNELHKKLGPKGVVFTGVNVWDGEKDAKSADRVKAFVKQQGEKMSYAVAIGGDAFIKDWLEAARVNGIPHAFVVSEGKLVWAGHPMEMNEEMLGDILTGTFDPKKNAKKANAGPPVDPEAEKAQAKLNKLGEAMARKDWKAAEAALADAASVLPPEERQDLIDSVNATIAMAKGDPTKLYKMLEKVAEAENDDAESLNELAWDLVTNPQYEKFLNLALAEKCALRAVELTKSTEADKLDTLARVRWLQGRREEAVQLQQQAVAKSADADMRASVQKTLDAMRKGVLPKAELPEER
jgi:thiol-disulfide isomerase/thioredoxin